jgi:hypothetical protein
MIDLMRKIIFLLLLPLSAQCFAAEVDTFGIYANGKSISIADPYLSQCSEKSRSEIARILDCTSSAVAALKGAIYKLNPRATRKNGGDPVFTCMSGCNKNIIQTIKYVTLESGC